MVKAKKGKKKTASSSTTALLTSTTSVTTGAPSTTTTTMPGATSIANDSSSAAAASTTNNNTYNSNKTRNKNPENLDDLNWLRDCELRHTVNGEPYLQLEYQPEDELILLLHSFLEESAASPDIVDAIYQIWQHTVVSTLLQSSAVWRKASVTATDQRHMKETLKTARYKINFILHHVTGSMLTSPAPKWVALRESVLTTLCYNTLQLVPRLAESCPHHATDIRQAIIHFEGKEFLAVVACETWDALYDFAIPIDPGRFIPVLRRCAMLDILDKDWNMLGGWEDVLKGIEIKCCMGHYQQNNSIHNNNNSWMIHRLQSDAVLHETTTVLRNARNSMQCKFFSVRFMRYTEDQAPQRWRYFPKCSAPACSNIETAEHFHKFRCRKCWYFHYCSASCQEYCDNIMGLHPKFCKDTPASKAALCQKETEQYLGWLGTNYHDPHNNATTTTTYTYNADGTTTAVHSGGVSTTGRGSGSDGSPNNNNVMARISCQACGSLDDDCGAGLLAADAVPSTTTTTATKIKRCIQCQTVTYCSRQCQEWDWRVGGHRDVCRALNGGKSSFRAAADARQQQRTENNATASSSSSAATNLVLIKDLN